MQFDPQTNRSRTNPRPLWPAYLCAILLTYTLINVPILVCGAIGSYAFNDYAFALEYLMSLVSPVLLVISSFGVALLKKWGAILFGVSIILDVILNIVASGGLITFRFMPFTLLLFDLHPERYLPIELIFLAFNIVYYLFFLTIGIAVWRLWQNNWLN